MTKAGLAARSRSTHNVAVLPRAPRLATRVLWTMKNVSSTRPKLRSFGVSSTSKRPRRKSGAKTTTQRKFE